MIWYSEHKSNENDNLYMQQWEQRMQEGKPARVVVTATWQMNMLSRMGYVPDDKFSWSQWSGPHGCYVLQSKKE